MVAAFSFYLLCILSKYVMISTREEKEKLVLDLYNQGKSTREIAEEARMSFRDIGTILNKAIEEKKTSKEQTDKVTKSTQAYKLFSEGKSPVQVAIALNIALNIREPEVTKFYVEYWSWHLRCVQITNHIHAITGAESLLHLGL
jgi:DNA-binding CsgD family transcriptional regulator